MKLSVATDIEQKIFPRLMVEVRDQEVMMRLSSHEINVRFRLSNLLTDAHLVMLTHQIQYY